MTAHRLLLCLVISCVLKTTAYSIEPADLQAWLDRPIIGPQLAQEEVATYCEAHVAPIPDVKTPEAWDAEVARMRKEVREKVLSRGEAANWFAAKGRVEWLDTIDGGLGDGGEGYHIRKLRYEAVPGLWIPALLYRPDKLAGKVPAVLNVNGHDPDGKVAKYKQIRCINQAKRGMLALNVEWLGMGQLKTDNFLHYRANQLDLCGTSGQAVFYLAMSRALDLLLALPNADPDRVAVMGLSGGGWQTITISSLDPRVTFANPVAGYSGVKTRTRNVSDLGDTEQTPTDLAMIADYTALTGMRAPRPTLLTFNSKDQCCFKADHALQPLLDAAKPIFALYGKENNLRWHINDDPGTHNFEKDNREAMYAMLGEFFYPGSFDPKEIECESELKTKEQLNVPLPDGNQDFHTLAVAISKNLPHQSDPPADKSALAKWQEENRKTLREIVRYRDWKVNATKVASEEKGGIKSTHWSLKIGDAWTVPAVQFEPAEAKSTVILVSESGRKSVTAEVQKLLAENKRVIAVDPFYFGESHIEQRDHLFAILVASVGDRPLGVQAGQLAAIARWADAELKAGPITFEALGPRSSLFSLVAGAIEAKSVAGVELHKSYGSLKEIIEQNGTVEQTPEIFCLGLLERFDIKQLAELMVPRQVSLLEASDRVKSELGRLTETYGIGGTSSVSIN